MRWTLLLACPLIAIPLMLLSSGCGPQGAPSRGCRVAVPPSLLNLFEESDLDGRQSMSFAALRPYRRARDLEVLLFSSRSTAFDAVVLPGRYLPGLRPWLGTFPGGAPAGVRADVAESVGGVRPYALPLTIDFGVMVIRQDLWSTYSLPSPSSLAGLRDAMMTVKSRVPGMLEPIASDLPMDELFWDLSWSFEGEAAADLYTFPKVHVLDFLREFGVGRPGHPSNGTEEILEKGGWAVVFTSLHRAASMCRRDRRLALCPLPARSGRAQVLYNGWCLARPEDGDGAGGALRTLEAEPFQEHLARSGFIGARPAKEPPPAEVDFALRRTEIHGAPDLGPGGDEVVLEALQDATETGMSAEEALRRAAARLEQIGRSR